MVLYFMPIHIFLKGPTQSQFGATSGTAAGGRGAESETTAMAKSDAKETLDAMLRASVKGDAEALKLLLAKPNVDLEGRDEWVC